MKILIDGDGCPVIEETIDVATSYGISCVILCDTSHECFYEDVETILLPKGKDSVDFALVNHVEPRDIVVTQDYGLAAMCLAKHAFVVNQNGLEYTSDNMNGMLTSRQQTSIARKHKIKTTNTAKRTHAQDTAFVESLTTLLSREVKD